jgi:hypothetical protein
MQCQFIRFPTMRSPVIDPTGGLQPEIGDQMAGKHGKK